MSYQQPPQGYDQFPNQYPSQGYDQLPSQYPPQGYPNQQPPAGYPNQYPPQGYPPPYQQPPTPQPKKKSKLWLWITIGIIGVIIIAVAAGNHSSTSPNTGTISSTSNTSSNTAPAQTTTQQHFKVGDTVNVGTTWKAVVNTVKTDDGGQFSSLKAGDTYLVVNITLTNLSSRTQTISSILNFTLQDSTGQKYDESIDANSGATLDGQVVAGSPLGGSIAYEVPASMKTFTLSFTPDITTTDQTIWDLNV